MRPLVVDTLAVLCEAVGVLVGLGDSGVVGVLEGEDGLLGVQDGRVLELVEGARDGVVFGRAVHVEHALAVLIESRNIKTNYPYPYLGKLRQKW